MKATKYFQIAKKENSFSENLELAKEQGFTHIFMWINSDLEWTFFAKSLEEAEQSAIELYMSEKKSGKEQASEYYPEAIDIYGIEEYLEIVNS